MSSFIPSWVWIQYFPSKEKKINQRKWLKIPNMYLIKQISHQIFYFFFDYLQVFLGLLLTLSQASSGHIHPSKEKFGKLQIIKVMFFKVILWKCTDLHYLYIEAKSPIFIWFHSNQNKIVMGNTTVGLIEKEVDNIMCNLCLANTDLY